MPLADLYTSPEYRLLMQMESEKIFLNLPPEEVIRKDGDQVIVKEKYMTDYRYELVLKDTYPRTYGSITPKDRYVDHEKGFVLVGYVVGIVKRPEDDNDADWENLGEFLPGELEQAIELLWSNREKAYSNW